MAFSSSYEVFTNKAYVTCSVDTKSIMKTIGVAVKAAEAIIMLGLLATGMPAYQPI